MKKLVLLFMLVVFGLANTDRGLKVYFDKHKSEKKVALVIGNANYQKVKKLKNPVNDAKAMRNTLQKLGFNVLFLENGTAIEMQEKVDKFTNLLKRAGVGFFYYAGHGIQVNGENYLIPVNVDIKKKEYVKYKTLALNMVLDKMEDSHDRLNIVVLDACRNNPFADSRGLGDGGLAPIQNGKGMFIAYATAPGKTASDGSGNHGVFTKYLIQNITVPNLPIEKVFKNVREEVAKDTDENQLPWTTSSIMGDFYFNLNPNLSTNHQKSQQLSNSLKPDEILWNKIKNSKNIDDYKFFIKLYPNSMYISVAKFNVYKLKPKKVVSNDKTWIDPDTGFMWQNEKYTQKEKKAFDGDYNYGKVHTWQKAKEYCNNLNLAGYSDWWLPSRKELKTIMTKTKYQSSNGYKYYIKKPLLKNMPPLNGKYKGADFWSSTSYANFSYGSHHAWTFGFRSGDDDSNDKDGYYYVRCVRDK